jgi:hypothetical protein
MKVILVFYSFSLSLISNHICIGTPIYSLHNALIQSFVLCTNRQCQRPQTHVHVVRIIYRQYTKRRVLRSLRYGLMTSRSIQDHPGAPPPPTPRGIG